MKKTTKKLVLAKETVRNLRINTNAVVGGASGRDSCTCYTETSPAYVTYWGPPC